MTNELLIRQYDYDNDGSAVFYKIKFPNAPMGTKKYFENLSKAYPKTSQILDSDNVIGTDKHPYAASAKILDDDEAFTFLNTHQEGLPSGKAWISGECDQCGMCAAFIVSEEESNEYYKRITKQSNKTIQEILPSIPPQWREMFLYPMPCTCPYCYQEMFGRNPLYPTDFSRAKKKKTSLFSRIFKRK